MEDEEPKCPPPGLPLWMGTFADLMSLLMCFFVLLLSFSEMDVLKFKQIAGSMKFAFGVQNRLEVKDIPKGTSIIAQEFRPGRPEPTPIDVIMQQTIDITQQTLEFHEGESDRAGGTQRDKGKQTGGKSPDTSTQDSQNSESDSEQQQSAELSQELETLMESIKKALEREIEQGAVEVENLGQQIDIRIREKGAFPEGSAFLQPKFRPLVRQIAELVKDIPGIVRVSGHTDNQRLQVRGMADTQPLGPNDTEAQRSRNRRVEISIMQGEPLYSDEVPSLPSTN
ncbi:flagellar motor protein MotB [Vibrio neptunius]|uniref:flagellar motor protein MotB n=1 Tax=Vibrio neptunius TaxID=170651 RepID=UPI0019D1566F|nr:flagellar motor protein MotB [Vibrio neptunius]MBN3491559.1 flagellar motor protein MotB [Vibrio neptunius]